MFEKMNRNEKAGLLAAFIVVIGVSAAAGFYGAGMTETPTGQIGSEASGSEIRSDLRTILDQQVARQRQQLMMMAQQNENISAEDLSISAEVGEPTESDIAGLLQVPVEISGKIPSQTGQIEESTQKATYYVSADGKLLFQQPTEIEKTLSQIEKAQQQAQQVPEGTVPQE